MSCDYETYNERKKRKEVFAHYEYIKGKKCCNKETCEKLSQEFEDLQYDCDDAFRNMHEGQLDEKGLTQGTLCETIKKTKNTLLDTLHSSRGGKKYKCKTKRRRQQRRKQKRKTYKR
jgi:hypothetical protein